MRLLIPVGILTAGLLSAATASASIELVTNGGFDTATLANWTVANTTNGTTQFQTVASFDTTGLGANSTASFNIGRVSGGGDGNPAGVELWQILTVSSMASIHLGVDVATANPTLSTIRGGSFSLVFNGIVVDQLLPQSIGPGEIRGSLSGSLSDVAPGAYRLSVFVLRDFQTAPGLLS